MSVPKPSTLPRWADQPSAQIVEPNDGKKGIGWVPGEEPPAQYFNWWQRLVYDWIQWLGAILDRANIWTAGQEFEAANTYRGDDFHLGSDIHRGREQFTGTVQIDGGGDDNGPVIASSLGYVHRKALFDTTNTNVNQGNRVYMTTYGFDFVAGARWDPGSSKWIQDDGTYPHLFRLNGTVGTVGWYQHSGGSAGAAFDDGAWEQLAGIDATIEGAPTDLTHKKYVDAQDASILTQAENFAAGNMAPGLLMFGAQAMPLSAGQLSLPPGFLAGTVSGAAGPEMPMPFAGKVTSLYISNLYNIGGGFQPKAEVYKNFAPTGLACFMGGSGSGPTQYFQAHDTAHPFTFNAGDVIQVMITLPGGMTTPPTQVIATLGITRA
jgi:hypothetical protein